MSSAKRWSIVALLLGAFFCLSLASISTKSATFDEVQHFGIGKYLLLKQRWDVMGSIIHPPLGYYITSLPLLFSPLDESLWKYEDQSRDLIFLGGVDILRGQGQLAAPENQGDRLLILSRLTVLSLALLLGLYVYRFSAELYGTMGGLLSLVFFSFCPTMLAFSGISTQDMPLATFSFITVYYFWHYLQVKNLKNAVLAGVFLGLALATKFTAFIMIPFVVFLYGFHLYSLKIKPDRTVLIIPLLAAVILFGSYGFNLTPFMQGNEYRLLEMKKGQAAFFNGMHATYGWWYFYLAALLLKTPLPFLLLYGAALIASFRKFRDKLPIQLMLHLPVVVFIVLFSCSSYSVGVRYLLPMFPFMFVSIGSIARMQTKVVVLLVGFLTLWQVGGTIRVSPDYLAYFNEIGGGADGGYRYLVDSNLDWGQDLKGLKKFMLEKGVKRVSLSYFGADSPDRYGIEYDWLPSHYLRNPQPDRPYDVATDQLLAISATNLQGVYLDNANEFAWLRKCMPSAKIGYSIFIYDPQEILKNGCQ